MAGIYNVLMANEISSALRMVVGMDAQSGNAIDVDYGGVGRCTDGV